MESLLLFYVEKPLLHILYIVSFPDLICIFLFQHVEEASVRIIVMANIQISPPVVYLMQHTHVKYTVELIKQNKVQRELLKLL